MAENSGHLFLEGGRLNSVGAALLEQAARQLQPFFQWGPNWEVAQILKMAVEDLRMESVLTNDEETTSEDSEDLP
jgi:hypothetical protein